MPPSIDKNSQSIWQILQAFKAGVYFHSRFLLLAIMGVGIFLLIIFFALVWLLEVVFDISLSSISMILTSAFFVPLAMVFSIIYRYKKSMPVDLRTRVIGFVIFYAGLGFLFLIFTRPSINLRGKGGAFILFGSIVAIPVGALMAIIGLYSNEGYVGKDIVENLFKKFGNRE